MTAPDADQFVVLPRDDFVPCKTCASPACHVRGECCFPKGEWVPRSAAAPKTAGELREAVARILEFVIAEARLHDCDDGLIEEQTNGILNLLNAAAPPVGEKP